MDKKKKKRTNTMSHKFEKHTVCLETDVHKITEPSLLGE